MPHLFYLIRLCCLAAVFATSLTSPAFSQTAPPSVASARTLEERVSGMRHMDGLFPLDYDAKTGRLYLEVAKLDDDFLLVQSLPYGLGSNDLGLDRGVSSESRVVHFTRSGPKLLLVEPNLQYRSSSPDADERLAVSQSFAESVLAGFPIEAEGSGKVLIDINDFALSDRGFIAEHLTHAKQGAYRLDTSRSALTLDTVKDFPRNIVIESLITFTSEAPEPSSLVSTVTPDAHAVSLHQRLTLVALPGPGYQPRIFDPRAGYFDASYRDYSAPLGSPLDLHFITRHRLIKKDPNAAMSEPVEPIVYYVDRGAPEPIRSALVEGASWWNAAFEAAGFRNAFRVEVLPAGADPMDIRYNMIQWVHRSTRGWSYGEGITDPRTGEIIKGQVTLGSLRVRQDWLIAEGLLSPYKNGKTEDPAIQTMVLARTRQLAAHEVGHTLGLAHNFAASSLAPGASVMDYPSPYITLDVAGHPDLTHAYTAGIGSWDKVAIAYGYSQFAPKMAENPAAEHAALDALLHTADKRGLYFITDEDSRPEGSVHPYAHLWDNGADPAAELNRMLDVRAAALAQFGENAILPGTPYAQLEDTLVPLYLLHRYQTTAAAKEIGGQKYRYALRGDGQLITADVPAADQQRALGALLKTLSPATLSLPALLLKLLPPRPPAWPRTRESFDGHTGLTFDPDGAAAAAANITLNLLFEPTRATRLYQQHLRDPQFPSVEELIGQTLSATWKAPRATGAGAGIQSVTEEAVTEHLLRLAADEKAAPAVRAIARSEALGLRDWLRSVREPKTEEAAIYAAAAARIDQFERDPAKFTPAPQEEAPPGMPIGEEEMQ